jgi:3,4-dihydroxy 2-butanone 4-phosphate synthase / GTP cyclohydrolase II
MTVSTPARDPGADVRLRRHRACVSVAASEGELAGITEAVDALRSGQMVIVVDDADRENEGDFVLAAEHVSPQAINFMATFGRGLICVPMRTEALDALDIPPAVAKNTDPKQTAFRVSVDHAQLTTTGISATDRANTIRALVDPSSRPADFTRPGHVFPLGYTEGGVLSRPGHTEAAVDLAELSGLAPAGVICEICSVDGDMARLPELLEVGEKHGIPVLRIAELIAYRQRELCNVTRAGEARLPLVPAAFRAIGFVDGAGREHIALVMGSLEFAPVPLVSIHAECLLGDVFGMGRNDLQRSLSRIAEQGNGVLIYLREAKTPAVSPSTCERSLSQHDERVAHEILANLGVRHFRRLKFDRCYPHIRRSA